jgi:penicillin-binding protein 1B
VTGSSGALKLWTALMQQVATQPVFLAMPDSVVSVWIEPETGLLANELCEGAVKYAFVRGSEPKENAACVDTPVNKAKMWINEFIKENF